MVKVSGGSSALVQCSKAMFKRDVHDDSGVLHYAYVECDFHPSLTPLVSTTCPAMYIRAP